MNKCRTKLDFVRYFAIFRLCRMKLNAVLPFFCMILQNAWDYIAIQRKKVYNKDIYFV